MTREKMKMRAALAACFTIALFGCAPTQKVATAIDTRLDCRAVCNRYKTCYDNTYQTNACEQRCDDQAKADGDFKRKADACNECMSQNACMQTSTACVNDCSPVIPVP